MAVLTTSAIKAQTTTPDKTLATIEAMPRTKAKAEMEKWLDATAQTGRKQYKALIASLEEMLSEPTWDYHNEELFAKVMEHASTASCLSDNERLRPKSMLEVVRKNAPGTVANEINYETLDGTHHKLSDISTLHFDIFQRSRVLIMRQGEGKA